MSEAMLIEKNFAVNYSDIMEKIKGIITLNNTTKKRAAAFLIDSWVCQQTEIDKYIYYKHTKSNKQNKLYQIVLSGNEFDGIYEFNLKGFNIALNYIRDRWNKTTLQITSLGNYDIALFHGKLPEGYCNKEDIYGYSITRADYETEGAFKKALLNTGLISEEEYNNFTSVGNDKYSLDKDRVIFD